MTTPLPQPLPRGACSRCGHNVAVRVNGTAREHRRLRRTSDEMRLPPVCPGSGEPVKAGH